MGFLQSQRIQLRNFTLNDYGLLYQLDSNPAVMKFLGNGLPSTPERIRENLRLIVSKYEEWKSFGLWAAELKETNEFIGWFALKPLPKIGDIEIGYRLLPQYWGLGFATEGARLLRDYGFENLKLPKIVAITHLENKASQRVLIKNGFSETGLIPNPYAYDDFPEQVCLYEICRDKATGV
jgi:[ribosomal protein S5]-alanine N-acetyltransferase